MRLYMRREKDRDERQSLALCCCSMGSCLSTQQKYVASASELLKARKQWGKCRKIFVPVH